MTTTEREKSYLQNFADKFDLTVEEYRYQDKRKKSKFFLTRYEEVNGEKIRVLNHSSPLNYDEMNCFLRGMLYSYKNNITNKKLGQTALHNNIPEKLRERKQKRFERILILAIFIIYTLFSALLIGVYG
jgi:hypothetical protein